MATADIVNPFVARFSLRGGLFFIILGTSNRFFIQESDLALTGSFSGRWFGGPGAPMSDWGAYEVGPVQGDWYLDINALQAYQMGATTWGSPVNLSAKNIDTVPGAGTVPQGDAVVLAGQLATIKTTST